MAITGDVSVPVLGSMPKKTVVGVLVVVTGVAGILYFRRKKNAAAPAATAATTADQYPPDGTTGNPSDPYSTDPATGQTYGDEATGSGGTYGAYGAQAGGFDSGSGMYYDPATGQYDLSSPYQASAGTTTPGGPPFSSNSQWSNWVIAQLQSQDPGISTGALVTALGLYIEGQPVDSAQKVLIDDARALAGDPPVAGANGSPPDIRLSGGKGGKVTAHNPVAGLREGASGNGDAAISWDAADHATGYQASLSGGARRSDSVKGTSHTFSGLKAGKYTASVLATPAGAGARPATIDVTVK